MHVDNGRYIRTTELARDAPGPVGTAVRDSVGIRCPHHVPARPVVGAGVAPVLILLARRAAPLVDRPGGTRPRPLVAAR
ncbi:MULTISPECIES: hypothetical protein [unclassified Streptomyces]|uniref:hypothetical protein n=1 Tax=unclassified Streptomyces TaxID=2593676 RepID=UPI0033C089E9